MSIIGDTSLSFSEEQSMLLEVANDFCRVESPISAVRAQLESSTGFDEAAWGKIVSLGWLGIALPESCGGAGLGVSTVVPVVEAMGRGMLGTPLVSTTLASQLLLRAGGAESLAKPLTDMAEGSIATVALLENSDWGDPTLECSVGPDRVLQGKKRLVMDASVASHFVVVAEQEGAPVLAWVRAESLPEGTIKERVLIDQTKRAADVDFSGVQADEVVTGDAVPSALRDLRLLGALLTAAEASGTTGACLDSVVRYLKARTQFGRQIGGYQALKHPTVEILNLLNQTRAFVYHAATIVSDASLGHDAEVACRMAKAQATEALCYASDRAVQFHGGVGFTYECDAQLYIRRAQWSQQQFGDARHHRQRLAGLMFDDLAPSR